MKKTVTLEEVVQLAAELPLTDKVRLIEKVAPQIQRELEGTNSRPRQSLWGLCADLGPAPSAEEINQARREAWAGFPRDDV